VLKYIFNAKYQTLALLKIIIVRDFLLRKWMYTI